MIYIITAFEGPLWAVERVQAGHASVVAIYQEREKADALRAVLSAELSAWRDAYGKED